MYRHLKLDFIHCCEKKLSTYKEIYLHVSYTPRAPFCSNKNDRERHCDAIDGQMRAQNLMSTSTSPPSP